MNGGICLNIGTSFSCLCPIGYSGIGCQIDGKLNIIFKNILDVFFLLVLIFIPHLKSGLRTKNENLKHNLN
jgi:hypothetical protein